MDAVHSQPLRFKTRHNSIPLLEHASSTKHSSSKYKHLVFPRDNQNFSNFGSRNDNREKYEQYVAFTFPPH